MKLSNFFLMSIIVLSVLLVSRANAQESKVLAGAGLGYATGLESVAIFAKGVYKITDEWEGSVSMNYYPGTTFLSFVGFDFNGHYVFLNQDKFSVYGLSGLNVMRPLARRVTYDYDDAYGSRIVYPTLVGLNIGGGGRFAFSDKFSAMAELKYTIRSGGYLQLSTGVLYHF